MSDLTNDDTPPRTHRPDSTLDLDSISLEQALKDFEVANGRVIDLTARLTTMNRDLVEARTERERLRLENTRLRSRLRKQRERADTAQGELSAVQESTSYRAAASAGRLVARARKRMKR